MTDVTTSSSSQLAGELAEAVVSGALADVPYVGHILSDLVPIFWPGADNSVWWEMEKQVEALIEQDLDQLVYTQVDDNLSGLSNNLSNYLSAVNDADNEYIRDTWTTVVNLFDNELPNFQASGYELLLLPLFTQAVNMYLSLLRDGALFATSWGFDPSVQQTAASKLSANIHVYHDYARNWFNQGIDKVTGQTKKDNHECEPFKSVNAYVRNMTLNVGDFGQLWPFMDVTRFPNPQTIYLGREIYSDPVGTCDDSGNIVLPLHPAKPPNQITVWAWDRVDAVQLTYPSGQGPGAVTTTARMGDQSGGSDQSGHGGVFNVQDNPVVIAEGSAGDILNAFNFTFKNGTMTGKMGGQGGTNFQFKYNNEILSSIHINGVSNYYGSADCAVFGFKYVEPENPTYAIDFSWVNSTGTV